MMREMFISQPHNDPIFCYLLIDYKNQAYTAYGLVIIAILLIFFAFIQFLRTKAQDKLNFNIKIIYLSIFALQIFYILKITLSEVAFYKSYSNSKQQVSQFNSTISKYIFSTEFFQFFSIQTMLLMVSYNWIDNTIQILEYILGTYECRLHTHREKKVLKIIKFCLIIRVVQIFIINPFAYFESFDIIALIVKTVIFVWVFQELFLTIIFVLTAYLVYNNKRLKQLLDPQQSQKMMVKYGILAGLMLGRFFWSVVYTVIMLSQDYIFTSGACYLEQRSSEVLEQIFFPVKGITTFVIIWIVLKIFHINANDSRSSSESYTQITQMLK